MFTKWKFYSAAEKHPRGPRFFLPMLIFPAPLEVGSRRNQYFCTERSAMTTLFFRRLSNNRRDISWDFYENERYLCANASRQKCFFSKHHFHRSFLLLSRLIWRHRLSAFDEWTLRLTFRNSIRNKSPTTFRKASINLVFTEAHALKGGTFPCLPFSARTFNLPLHGGDSKRVCTTLPSGWIYVWFGLSHDGRWVGGNSLFWEQELLLQTESPLFHVHDEKSSSEN